MDTFLAIVAAFLLIAAVVGITKSLLAEWRQRRSPRDNFSSPKESRPVAQSKSRQDFLMDLPIQENSFLLGYKAYGREMGACKVHDVSAIQRRMANYSGWDFKAKDASCHFRGIFFTVCRVEQNGFVMLKEEADAEGYTLDYKE